MKIMLVAGGSGGHIYPALELAKYFKDKGEEVLLAGSKNSMEETIYKESGLDYVTLDITKRKIKSFFNNYKDINEIYKKYKPDKIILFGNYISASFALVAILKKIPIYLHEQNVVYGKANKLLARFAKRIYLSLPIENNAFKRKSLLVGNPKGDITKFDDIYLPRNKKNVFIVMGSLGSETINNLLLDLTKICDSSINYHIVTGKKHYENFNNKYMKKDNAFIYPYLNNLIAYTSKCDLFVSRSGATTLTEIINYKIPSILIPSPYVSNNHQFKNAKFLSDNDAAYLMEENNISASGLHNKIKEILNDENTLRRMKKNLMKLNVDGAKKKIYGDIKDDQ